jgi:hypothetical protein
MAKQTAVEFLVDKWLRQGTLYSSDCKQALELEKQQIIDAFEQGDYTGRGFEDVTSEEFYNINFKSE